MNEGGWFKNYDSQKVLIEMKTARMVSIQGSCKKYTTELTQFQKWILELYRLIVETSV